MERYLNSIESSESKDFTELLSIVERLEILAESKEYSPQEVIDWSRELVRDLFQHIESDLGLHMSADVNDVYKKMNQENLLARVESVKRIVECLARSTPIEVGVGNDHYANSVTSDLEGLRIAMAEAEALGPVRLLVGLDLKALVGFTNDHVQVSEIDDNEFDLRDTSLRKAYCRHLDGEIHKEDIRYMVLRVPRKVFPDSLMNDMEKKQQTNFIFRSIIISAALEGELRDKAA